VRRFILTGTSGAGKTAILRQLECDGFNVVEEAATDVIALESAKGVAEPWGHASFIDAVVDLQWQRQIRSSRSSRAIQFHDRSVICTAALAGYLGYPFSEKLKRELTRVDVEEVFQRRVFFVRSLGFLAPTVARQISLEEAERFERVHETVYRELGFELVSIPPGSVADRAAAIERAIGTTPPRPAPRRARA
jgi:predicted ATPase